MIVRWCVLAMRQLGDPRGYPRSGQGTGLQPPKMPSQHMHVELPTRPQQLSVQRLGYGVDVSTGKGRPRPNEGMDALYAMLYRSNHQLAKPLE